MYNFKNLNSVKSKTDERDELRNDRYDNAYLDALDCLEKFNSSGDFSLSYLQKATDNLIIALENKKNNAEPYICLACIFHILNDSKLAIKYLKIAQSVNHDLPQIDQLKELISNNSNVDSQIKLIKTQPVNNIAKEPVVTPKIEKVPLVIRSARALKIK